MAKAGGYVSLHRRLLQHWLWPSGRAYTECEAWLWLLMNAAYATHTTYLHGKKITVNRGDLMTSERKLSGVFGWGRRRVGQFLEMLEHDGMIATDGWGTKWSMLKISNYSSFQESNAEKNDGPVNSRKSQKSEATPKASDSKDSQGENQNTAPLMTPQAIPQPPRNPAQSEAIEGAIIKVNKGNNNSLTGTSSPSPQKNLFSGMGIAVSDTGKQAGHDKKQLWDTGLALLKRAGEKDRSARSFLGGLVKKYGISKVLDALEVAEREEAVDPKAFLVGVLKAMPLKSTGKTAPFRRKRETPDEHKAWLSAPECGCWQCQEEIRTTACQFDIPQLKNSHPSGMRKLASAP